jgi:hypothetical protein
VSLACFERKTREASRPGFQIGRRPEDDLRSAPARRRRSSWSRRLRASLFSRSGSNRDRKGLRYQAVHGIDISSDSSAAGQSARPGHGRLAYQRPAMASWAILLSPDMSQTASPVIGSSPSRRKCGVPPRCWASPPVAGDVVVWAVGLQLGPGPPPSFAGKSNPLLAIMAASAGWGT